MQKILCVYSFWKEIAFAVAKNNFDSGGTLKANKFIIHKHVELDSSGVINDILT